MVVRKLIHGEMAAAAKVHRAAFDERLPWLAGLHTPEEDRRYFEDQVFPSCDLWGAFDDGALQGFVAVRDGWIDQLYVAPERQGAGIGTALLDIAKAERPQLRLWTFQRNLSARQFYERHGFRVVEETDGTRNEEREPDVLYEWSRWEDAAPTHP